MSTSKDDGNVIEDVTTVLSIPLRKIEQDMTFEERKNLLLLNQIILFILNTSHYMTDLIYALYFLSYSERGDRNSEDYDITPSVTHSSNTGSGENRNKNIMEQLTEIRKQLYALVYQVRNNFRQLLDECDMTDKESAPKFRKLIDRNLVRVLGVINELLISEMKSISPPLSLQLHNCTMGFANLYQFLKKVPLHHQYQITKPQLDILLQALGQELIPSWKFQLDLLNYKLFNSLAANDSLVAEYRKKTGNNDSSVKAGQGFRDFVVWLKDEIIRNVAL